MSAGIVKLPRGSERRIDVRDLLLNNQSDPKVKTPRELQAAIDAKARALAEEAYALCREHLRRRVAWSAEWSQPREINMPKAYQLVADGDLGDALVRVYRQKMMMVVEQAKSAARISERFAEVADDVFSAIEGQRPA
jgi:hypothetical protein